MLVGLNQRHCRFPEIVPLMQLKSYFAVSFGQLCPFRKNLKSGVVVAIDSGSFSRLEVTTPVRNLFSDEFPVLFVEFIRQPLEVIPDHVQVDPRECDHCWFAIRVVANDGEISVSLPIFRGRCQFDSDLHLWAFC